MMRSNDSVAREVAAICQLPREELAERWERICGSVPSPGIRTELLVRSAAWQLQAKQLGGLSAGTRRLLKAAMAEIEAKLPDRTGLVRETADGSGTAPALQGDDDAGRIAVNRRQRVATTQRRTLLPGARLLRDWNGRTHVVDVIEGGYVFEAKVYPSLTAIAATITGTHWSGPRFFGL